MSEEQTVSESGQERERGAGERSVKERFVVTLDATYQDEVPGWAIVDTGRKDEQWVATVWGVTEHDREVAEVLAQALNQNAEGKFP